MNYNQAIDLFREIATAHKQIHQFETGEIWEANGIIKRGIVYPLLYAAPIQTVYNENTVNRTFTLLVFGQVDKAKQYEQEMITNCEIILTDVIKILKNESDEYNLIGSPVMFPFKESFGDWCAGWRVDIELETNASNNYCDIPADDLTPIEDNNVVTIKDQHGNILYELNPGDMLIVNDLTTLTETYTVSGTTQAVTQTPSVVYNVSVNGQTTSDYTLVGSTFTLGWALDNDEVIITYAY